MTKLKQAEILEKVIKILIDETKGAVRILPESNLQQDLRLDSVGAIKLIAIIEAEFDITFEFSNTPPVTVKELAEFIERHIIG
jgi:acyl carrier protein